MFRDADFEWLQIIGCMKKAGLSIRDIRQYIEMALQGDNTLALRLQMFRRQREVLMTQMQELRHTLDMVDYKCWYYETALAAGTAEPLQHMADNDVPARYRAIWQELRRLPQTAHGADQRLAVLLEGHRPVAVGAVQHGGVRAGVPDGIAGVEQGILGIAAGEKQ